MAVTEYHRSGRRGGRGGGSYDLTNKWNPMNKINQQIKWNQKHRYMKQTGRYSRREGGVNWIKKVKGLAEEYICNPHGHRQFGEGHKGSARKDGGGQMEVGLQQ